MTDSDALSRRRFIRIVAMAGVAGLAVKFGLDDARPVTVTDTRMMMGTVVNLTVLAGNQVAAEQAVAACLGRMQALEGILSRFKGDSQLSCLNRRGILASPDPALVELIGMSNRVSHLSGGAFDITIKPLVDLYMQEFASGIGLPSARAIAQSLQLVGHGQIEADAEHIAFGMPGMAITLDGIAKGYIIDEGVAQLRKLGFPNVIVEAGGDLMAAGEKGRGAAWEVGIKSPRPQQSELLARIAVRNQAVATSGDYMQAYTSDFEHCHIIDPRTGYSSKELASATITAPSAALADCLATTLMVLGPEAGLGLMKQFPDCQACLVTKEMKVITTDGFDL